MERSHNAPGRLIPFPKFPFNISAESSAAVIAFNISHIHLAIIKHFGRSRFGDLHAFLGIKHIQNIGFTVIHTVVDTAKVIITGICCIGVVLNFTEHQLPIGIFGKFGIGLEAGIKPPFNINGLLLVVGGSNVQAHQLGFFFIAFFGQDFRAKHRTIILNRFVNNGFRWLAFALVVVNNSTGQIKAMPTGHNDDDFPAFFQTGKHCICEPCPMLFKGIGVVRFHC